MLRSSLANDCRPFAGQCEPVLPAVGRQRLAGDQAGFIEILHDPAEIAGIETQFGADLLGREILAVGEFVQHPGFAQRERALQQLLVEYAELAGIEAVEGADRRDLLFGIQLGHGTSSMIAIVKYILAVGKYIFVASVEAATPGDGTCFGRRSLELAATYLNATASGMMMFRTADLPRLTLSNAAAIAVSNSSGRSTRHPYPPTAAASCSYDTSRRLTP